MKINNVFMMLMVGAVVSAANTEGWKTFEQEFIRNTEVLSQEEIISEPELPKEPEVSKEPEALLVFAGDLCLEEDGFVIDKYDETGVLSDCISPEIIKKTNEADLFFLNHEYTCTTLGAPLEGKYYTFRAKPERMDIVKELGTDIVSLANNHIYDYGPEAMLDTIENIKKAGIAYVGGGANLEEAIRPVYKTVNGIKIGFVSASRAEKIRYTPEATEDSPGILRMYELDNIKKSLAEARENCDFLVAYVHWGTEGSYYYEEYQREIAKELFLCGADIIIGGHPHELQGMEYIDGKPVVYSLGDFWFNDETKYTGLLSLKITKTQIKEMQFVPCLQSGFTTTFISEEPEQRKLFNHLEEISGNVVIDNEGVIYHVDGP